MSPSGPVSGWVEDTVVTCRRGVRKGWGVGEVGPGAGGRHRRPCAAEHCSTHPTLCWHPCRGAGRWDRLTEGVAALNPGHWLGCLRHPRLGGAVPCITGCGSAHEGPTPTALRPLSPGWTTHRSRPEACDAARGIQWVEAAGDEAARDLQKSQKIRDDSGEVLNWASRDCSGASPAPRHHRCGDWRF